jgi:replicative DNA helicase
MKSAFTFGPAFQDVMLAMMIDDPSFATKAVGRVPVDKLYSAGHKWLFEVFEKSIADKGQVPSLPEVEDNLKKLDPSKRRLFHTFVKRIYSEVKIEDPSYIKEQLADYAKKNEFIEVFMGAQTLWNSKEHEKALELVMEGMNDIYAISFQDDTNVLIDDFEKMRELHIAKSIMGVVKIPTMIGPLDEQLNGGLEKKEMGIILADPKKGKSIGLVHMGCAALMMRVGRVAHFVLEGTTEQTIMRYESRLTRIPYNRINKDELTPDERKKLDKLRNKYAGRLEVVPMNTRWDYTVLDIEAKLKHMERTGNKPDLVIVDYGDLLTSHVRGLEKRHEQTQVYRSLKQLAMIYNVALWTASQAVRPKESMDKPGLLRAKDISESYEKVRIADLIMTLNQTPKEKTEGLLRLHLDIYRSNEFDRTIRMIQDYSKMIFYSKRYQHMENDEIPSWLRKKKSK